MKKSVENLIAYELKKGVIDSRDYHYVKNQIYHLLQLENDSSFIEPKDIKYPSDALEPILDELERKGILDGSKVSRDLFDAKIMDIFSMMPSLVEKHFYQLHGRSKKAATNWYYQYMQNLNYIRMDRIIKNKMNKVSSKYGNLEVTINLSKPEKDPKSIILASQSVSKDYPKCLLCIENEGFSGNFQRDSRDQHRLIKLDLNHEPYYFQYSPYIYYPEHAIVISEEHRPMVINQKTFANLLSLTDFFDSYFFGSNADLPIVGGSILSHDHYQGGHYRFPIEDAKKIKTWIKEDITYHILAWPLSTIRLEGIDKNQLVSQANDILKAWKNYGNSELMIYAKTGKTPHQTITPVARRKNDLYQLDLILRNNFTSKLYPLGLYHPHEDKWHIKKENIGLIEAMGLAILPARLKTELELVKVSLLENVSLHEEALKHENWVQELKSKYQFTKENIDQIINQEVGLVFEHVLEDCGVFKQDDKGIQAFTAFMEDYVL